jgi:hypothetical protein
MKARKQDLQHVFANPANSALRRETVRIGVVHASNPIVRSKYILDHVT